MSPESPSDAEATTPERLLQLLCALENCAAAWAGFCWPTAPLPLSSAPRRAGRADRPTSADMAVAVTGCPRSAQGEGASNRRARVRWTQGQVVRGSRLRSTAAF